MKFNFMLISSLVVLLGWICPTYVMESIVRCVSDDNVNWAQYVCLRHCRSQKCLDGYCQWQNTGQRVENICTCVICNKRR